MNKGLNFPTSKYTNTNLGAAGTIITNIEPGSENFHHVIPFLTIGELYPLDLSLIYIHSKRTINIGFGKGIRLSINFNLAVKDNGAYLELEYPDGSVEKFIKRIRIEIVKDKEKEVIDYVGEFSFSIITPSDDNLYRLSIKNGNEYVLSPTRNIPYKIYTKGIKTHEIHEQLSGFSIMSSVGGNYYLSTNIDDETGNYIRMNLSYLSVEQMGLSPLIRGVLEYNDDFLVKVETIHVKDSVLGYGLVQSAFAHTNESYVVTSTNDENVCAVSFTGNKVIEIVSRTNASPSYNLDKLVYLYENNKVVVRDAYDETVSYYFYNNSLKQFVVSSKGDYSRLDYNSRPQLTQSISGVNSFMNKLEDNFLKNGSFSNNLANWNGDGSRTIINSTPDPALPGVSKVCELKGNTELSQSFSFEGTINATISLSFWVKNEDRERLLRYQITLLNKGQVIKTLTTEYSESNNYFEQLVSEVTATNFFDTIRITFLNLGTNFSKTIIADVIVKSFPLKTIYEYDDDGNLLKTEKGLLGQTFEYDAYNHLIKTFGLGFMGNNYVYTKGGLLIQSSSQNLGTSKNEKYNGYGQITEQTISNSKQISTESYTYRQRIEKGPLFYTNARGITTSYSYSEKTQQITEVSTPLTKHSFEYDTWFRLTNESLSKKTGGQLYVYSLSYIGTNYSNRINKISNSFINYIYDFTPRYDLKKVSYNNNSSSTNVILTEYQYQDQTVSTSFTNTNLLQKKYYNGQYDFEYSANNFLNKIKYKPLNETIIDLFTYEYNALEQLVKVNNLVQPELNETFVYNQNNSLSQIKKNDVSQKYDYDVLGEQSSTRTIYNGKSVTTEINQNYRLYDFNPEDIYLRFQESNTKHANFVNLFDTTVNETTHVITSETINPNLVQFKKVNGNLVKNEIIAEKKEYEIIHDGRFNAFHFDSAANNHLEYIHNDTTNRIFINDNFSISFWFKIDNIFADNFLALMIDGPNKNTIVQINADEQQNVFVDVKFPGKSIQRGFMHTGSRYKKGWNFVSFSWKRYEYDQVSEYLLVVNGESDYKTEKNSTDLLLSNTSSLIIGAGFNYNYSSLVTSNADITGIVIDNVDVINVTSIFDYLKVSRKLYLYSSYLNSDLLTIANQGINDYSSLSKISSTYKVFPLHQSFFGLDGNNDVTYSQYKMLSSELDTSFAFNKKLNRYLYVADGDPLFYNTGLSNSGFIGMFFTRDEDVEYQCLFEATDTNGLSFSIERRVQGGYRHFMLIVNGVSYAIGGDTVIGERVYLGVTWTKTISGSSITQNTYRFRVNFKGVEKIHDINLSNSFTNLTLSLGRKTNQVIPAYNYGNLYNPLFGQIEFLTYNDLFMSNDSIISLINNLNGVTTSTQYDGLGLVRSQSLTNGNTLINAKIYNYFLPNETKKISSLVSQEVKTTKAGNKTSNFTYDELNNLTRINEDNVNTRVFAYDERGFLIYEAWPEDWAQNTYTYDYSGNILTISGSRNLSFTYETTTPSTLKRLIQAGSEYIDYLGTSLLPSSIYTKSSSGLPQNVANLSWQGKRLISYITPTKNCLYTYDDQGLRLSKSINGNETRYTYFNGLLTIERYNNITIRYRYDANNLVYGFTYEDGNNITEFFYDRDVLGLINGIFDSLGNVVVTYTYDAYGNIQGINDTSSIGIGTINKVRYKGYYYDDETSFYYCHTRYYVPHWTRWLSGDDVGYLDPATPSGLNLFVYCNNNPVMYIDQSGNFPVLAFLSLIALVGLGLTIGGVASDNNLLTGIGLTMIAIPALITGGIGLVKGIFAGATLTGIIGAGTIITGIGTGLFASAEYQEATGNGNWIIDTTGMSEGLYNGLLLTMASLATLGTIASSISYSFNIKSISEFGRYGDYYGMKFTTGTGKTHVLSFHTHGHKVASGIRSISEWHWQLQKWNPLTGKTSGTIARWIWWLLRRM
jgi:RHS repeat-associated protein